MKAKLPESRLHIPILLLIASVGMFGFGFGLVSLYDLFCQVTGFGGGRGLVEVSEQSVQGYAQDLDREISVLMLTKRGRGATTYLSPLEDRTTVNPGVIKTVNFRLTNPTDQHRIARAIPSLAPAPVASYLKKIECFCFNEQPIAPGTSVILPMRFVISADLPPNYGDDIAVSYTLFDELDTNPEILQKTSDVSAVPVDLGYALTGVVLETESRQNNLNTNNEQKAVEEEL